MKKRCSKKLKENFFLFVCTMDTYQQFADSVLKYESNSFYKNLLCLQSLSNGPAEDEKCDEYVKSVAKLQGRDSLKFCCVLPKGHTGVCTHKLDSLFVKNKWTEKLKQSLEKAIYYTPGNDDYVYKNRCSRLYKNVLSDEQQKKIRDKTIKKKCAIPLKDASTPILLAQAYIDWFTFFVNIKGIEEHLNTKDSKYASVMEMLKKNKNHLVEAYKHRKIFDKDGYTICVITRKQCTIDDFADPDRDNRMDIKDTDIQLGHNMSRDDTYVTIRGENLLPMSRRGNLIVGERVFTENKWIEELKQILSPY